ncbi:MAG: 2,3-bisphosphoglycerate-independent phosphoglycerate mutase [Chloroflexota bacterium]
MARGPCVLIVLDGWGIAPPGPGNALSLALTPNLDRYWAGGPHAALAASGLAVGLPEGQIGNSEVGHLNLGAGYRVLQELPRIDDEIACGSFFENESLVHAMEVARTRGSQLHLLGLFSYGGVHSHAEYLYALLELASRRGLQGNVAVHAFLDGRDTAPEQALADLPTLEFRLAETNAGRIATITGRYYAMDRDHRWDRVKKAYDALVLGQGEHASSAEEAVRRSYANGVTDEFILPTVIAPYRTMDDDDVVIWFNFRADRARQLTRALLLPHFDAFDRPHYPANLHLVTLTQYDASLPVHAIAYPPQLVEQPIAKVVAGAGLSQCHLAETEKYAHVTYFFNGGREEPFANEERVLIPSPNVATYDLQPEMSARGVAAAAIRQIEGGSHAFLVMNFANGDMVGHTGKLDAAIAAAEVVDAAVGEVVDATLEAGGFVAITSDHGNAEQMIDPETGDPKTAHTENPVPFMLAGAPPDFRMKETGVLADVAPTLLRLMQLPVPLSMKEHGL